MSASLAAWWGNPVTALFIAFGVFLCLTFSATSLFAITRLGEIPLVGLLSQRPRLLPGYPRHGDAHSGLALFLQLGTGLLLVLFSLSVVRSVRLVGGDLLGMLAVLVVGWFAAVAIAFSAARGARTEVMAIMTLIALRPVNPLLRLLVRAEEEREESEDDEDEGVDDHDVQAFIGAGEEAGILEREDAELIASIVDLSETVAREIMTPRTDIVAVPLDTPFDVLERRFAESMFTRIPAFRDTLDRIDGVVHVKDVLLARVAGKNPAAGELLRPVAVVPETKPLRELLREFQAARQQLAVVVDEYGGTAGIVTLEDVLEEIVGEIQDEHQRERPEVEKEAEGVFLLAGGAHVEVLEELFGVEIGDVSFDSVAGLVLDRLGHLPRVGEKCHWRNLELEVVEVERRRLRRVRIHSQEQAPA